MTRRNRRMSAEEEVNFLEGALFGGTGGDPFVRRIRGRTSNRMGQALGRIERHLERAGRSSQELAGESLLRRVRNPQPLQSAFPQGLRPRRVGDSWYSVEFRQARAGFRRMNGGSWGYYFRHLGGGAIGKQEYYCSSREDAIRRIKNVARKLGWTLP